MIYTYQDYLKDARNVPYAVHRVIEQHRAAPMVQTARIADQYDRQKNTTISRFVKYLYDAAGNSRIDTDATVNRITSAFFTRLNKQRVTYSLGNGVTFSGDGVKEKLGIDFDTRLKEAGYYSQIHGVAFLYWNLDHVHVFPVTEFAPLYDEETGALMAGVRYWQLAPDKPMQAVLYEIDGFTRLQSDSAATTFHIVEDKRAYRTTYSKAPADSEPEIIGEENYNALPIVPIYGNMYRDSTIIGMRSKIDAYDLIRSGFADDLQECSEIYWIVNNAGGMDDRDLKRFRERLKRQHIANVVDADDVSVTPYTQDIPYTSRQAYLNDLRAGIYEDFGGLDVHTVSAGATNDHIDAAYQPLDENADDFEYQIIQAVQQLLRLLGIDDTPIFKRNRISNQKEQTEMILSAATYLDDETILNKLPFISSDEIAEIMNRRVSDDVKRFTAEVNENENDTVDFIG